MASTPRSNRLAELELLRRMVLIREAEEQLAAVTREGRIPGAVHLYVGQEATAVGACSVLEETDRITSTHRGHGHFLAKGGDLKRMYAEIWGRKDGICLGMGGSMHVTDLSKGMLGANGIVGGGFAIATGAAFGSQLKGDGSVALCFFGDGAANQGTFMETMNISTAWKLPMIFLCENNGYAEFTLTSTITGGKLVDRAKAFMPAVVVDGNDVLAVQAAVREAVERARRGDGPSYVECETYRIHGHLEAEDAMLAGGTYRSEEEIAAWRTPEKDPIQRFQAYLRNEGVPEAEISRIHDEVAAEVQAATDFAENSGEADPTLALSLMYADQEN